MTTIPFAGTIYARTGNILTLVLGSEYGAVLQTLHYTGQVKMTVYNEYSTLVELSLEGKYSPGAYGYDVGIAPITPILAYESPAGEKYSVRMDSIPFWDSRHEGVFHQRYNKNVANTPGNTTEMYILQEFQISHDRRQTIEDATSWVDPYGSRIDLKSLKASITKGVNFRM